MKLYHYTTVETLFTMLDKSIMKNESIGVKYLELWAFPTSDMEDKSEYSLLTDKVTEEVKELAFADNRILCDKELVKLDNLCRCYLYTISLTERKDSSHMWEVYGNNHAGVCLEFDLDAIQPFYCSKDGRLIMENAYSSMLTRCKYVHSEDLEVEEDLVTNIYQYIINKGNDDVIKSAAMIARLENTAIVYKTMNFAQESEFRFVLGSVEPVDYIKHPIPISAITSITLGSSIKDEEKINLITQKITETLGDFIKVKALSL